MTVIAQVKRCIRGDKCVHPDGPELPLEEFARKYQGSEGRANICKACSNRENKRYRALPKDQAAHLGERLALDQLKTLGIYAVPGKATEWSQSRVDIIAWGCVRIEVKYANPDRDGRIAFTLLSNKRKNWHNADLVILIAGDTCNFYVFQTNHPVFYKNGRPKSAVTWKPGSTVRKHTQGVSLDDDIMSQHLNRWDLIATCRQTWAQRGK